MIYRTYRWCQNFMWTTLKQKAFTYFWIIEFECETIAFACDACMTKEKNFINFGSSTEFNKLVNCWDLEHVGISVVFELMFGLAALPIVLQFQLVSLCVRSKIWLMAFGGVIRCATLSHLEIRKISIWSQNTLYANYFWVFRHRWWCGECAYVCWRRLKATSNNVHYFVNFHVAPFRSYYIKYNSKTEWKMYVPFRDVPINWSSIARIWSVAVISAEWSLSVSQQQQQ